MFWYLWGLKLEVRKRLKWGDEEKTPAPGDDLCLPLRPPDPHTSCSSDASGGAECCNAPIEPAKSCRRRAVRSSHHPPLWMPPRDPHRPGAEQNNGNALLKIDFNPQSFSPKPDFSHNETDDDVDCNDSVLSTFSVSFIKHECHKCWFTYTNFLSSWGLLRPHMRTLYFGFPDLLDIFCCSYRISTCVTSHRILLISVMDQSLPFKQDK